MNRNRALLLLAILLVPGGLTALVISEILRRLGRTARGQRLLAWARRWTPAWAAHGLRRWPLPA